MLKYQNVLWDVNTNFLSDVELTLECMVCTEFLTMVRCFLWGEEQKGCTARWLNFSFPFVGMSGKLRMLQTIVSQLSPLCINVCKKRFLVLSLPYM